MQPKPRVAVIADFLEEGWPSMDCVAESLTDCLNAGDLDVAGKHHLAGVAQPGSANSLVTR